MLVHKAEMEAIAVVDCIVGKKGKVNYDCIPGVIYTSPEVAWVGQSEEELIKNNTPYNKGIFHINKNLRARITHEDKGLVKVMTCPETHKFLGIWIISNNAGEMITEGATAYHNGHTVQTIAETSHSHPTLSESFREACMAAYDKAIHI
jgi:dihydrolipoamide dehydrogenase